MIGYTLEQGKKPVWECHCTNIGSRKLAEKVGFRMESECTIMKKNIAER